MSGKYIVTKRIAIPMLAILIATSSLFGCGVASKQEAQQLITETPVVEVVQDTVTDTPNGEDNAIVAENTVAQFDWIEVGKLTDMPELRVALEQMIGVSGDAGSKTGSIYDGDDVGQNTTLKIAMEDTTFRNLLFSPEYASERAKLCEEVDNTYTDSDEDVYEWEKMAILLDKYFNLLPVEDETPGECNPYMSISRAQAMTM